MKILTRYALSGLRSLTVVLTIACAGVWRQAAAAEAKPVLLYSRYFNAKGETRYLPEGNYSDVLAKLRAEFDVRVHDQPLTSATLAGVQVVLISNPSDLAVGGNPAPPHVSAQDVSEFTRFVNGGGGVIIMGNQEDHNLETTDLNRLLGRFGLQFTNIYSDAKPLLLPKETPLLGGLTWGYYTGNLILVDKGHAAKPRGLIMNDLKQKPLKGVRDHEGVLLAVAEPGRGRVVLVTDSGWITNSAMDGTGVGDLVIKQQDNWEIFRRLAHWAAQR